MESQHQSIAAEMPRAIEDLAETIAVDTQFPAGAGYAAFADLAEPWLHGVGMETRRIVVPEPLWRTMLGGAHGKRGSLFELSIDSQSSEPREPYRDSGGRLAR